MGKHLTIGQTAKQLGLEVDTVRKLERAGKIRAIRTGGGHRRFTEEEIDRFRKSRRKARSRPAPRRPARTRTRQSRHPRTGEFLPRGVEVADDFDDFEEDLPFEEFDDDIASEVYPPPPAALQQPRIVQAPQRPFPHPRRKRLRLQLRPPPRRPIPHLRIGSGYRPSRATAARPCPGTCRRSGRER